MIHNHPSAVGLPPAAISRLLTRYSREQVEAFTQIAIDLLDLADGDPDLEETDTEDAFVLSPHTLGFSEGRGPGCEVSDAGGCEHDGREPEDHCA